MSLENYFLIGINSSDFPLYSTKIYMKNIINLDFYKNLNFKFFI